MVSRKSKKAGFLAGYRDDEKYLVKPDRALGKAGLFRARDPEGRDVLIKFWPTKKGIDESDLEEIWRSEIRQLQRIAAVPRADDLFVQLLTSGRDKDGYYVALDPGQGSPLAVFLDAEKKPKALAQAKPQIRRFIWSNVKRLAAALELLHSQGAIHRNIDPWAVLTALGDEPDFRLTGFEWSMRIASLEAKRHRRVFGPKLEKSFSFARDWRDLGLLIALLLDIPHGPLADIKIPSSRISEHITAAEVRLLRAMLGIERVDRLDGDFVQSKISEIIDGIAAEAEGREGTLCLAVRLGQNTQLSESVRKASGSEIETTDIEQQLHFIMDDLGKQPALVSIEQNANPVRYALVGQLLTYRLARYRQPGTAEEGTWEFAYCDRADTEAPIGATLGGTTYLSPNIVEVTTIQEAAKVFPRKRGKVLRWEIFLKKLAEVLEKKSDLERMHQSYSLLLLLEMAFAASEIFPVEIVATSTDGSADTNVVHVLPRNDGERAKLSELLGIPAPAVRFAKMVETEDERRDGDWALSEPGMLGERSATSTIWRYVRRETVKDIECFKFEGSKPPHRAAAFFIPAEMVGKISQFKRRLKALAVLREHAELLRMLVDPRRRIEDSHDRLDTTEKEFSELDASKQAALIEILSTVPLFLLQGPPGVGKTFLVGDVVRRRFQDESTTRILLSAQSNSAVDHLMNEVSAAFAASSDKLQPLMVRARSADDDEASGELEIDNQAGKLLQSLAKSRLAATGQKNVVEKLTQLAAAHEEWSTALSTNKKSLIGRQAAAELRAVEGMILRSANLVFATTNSYAVERLIEERGFFDWSIIEEAGKATGGELLSPLLLSHRRLMIGDHKQLPPFDIDKMAKLLSSTESVKEAVTFSEPLISRYLKDAAIDELFREIEAATDDFGATCALTLQILPFFETYVEQELTRQKSNPKLRGIARRLSEQYRMHPAIARIVSKCFYEGGLSTNKKKEVQYRTLTPPIYSKDEKRLAESPVTIVDMPYARSEGPQGRSGDSRPPWRNKDEATAVIETLKLMRVREGHKKPSLAVLSPYRHQVSLLRRKITNGLDGPLKHLEKFQPAISEKDYCGTVDSFQGGEADVVVISLVRNNAHTAPGKSLGFLRDSKRMNVLLSRAKWRLILIGSLDFYKTVVELNKTSGSTDTDFLRMLLDALQESEKDGNATIIPFSKLRGDAS